MLALAALSLAGCGGASAGPGTGGDSGTSSSSTTSAASTGARTEHSSQPVGRDIVTTGQHVAQARGIGNEPNDEVNASGAKTQHPCMLVSRSDAEAIVGKQVGTPVEAPQGPTCIYRPQGATSFITLAVESKNFSKVEPQSQLRDRISITVGGHAAYCGSTGNPMLIVPLSGGKFMAVAAPCPLAAAFAAKALSHLAS